MMPGRALLALALVALAGCGAESASGPPRSFDGTVRYDALGAPVALPVRGVASADARDIDVRTTIGVPIELRVRGEVAYVKAPERAGNPKPWGTADLDRVPWLDQLVTAVRDDLGDLRGDGAAALAAVPARSETFDATAMLADVGPGRAKTP